MKTIYNLLNHLFEFLLPLVRLLSPKLKLFVEGRKKTRSVLKTHDFSQNEWLWFHCASLGEYEQAVPLIEKLKNDSHKILVSFFSPSGYEQKKNHKLIDLAIYLPIDTLKNARYIVHTVKPKQAFFIKYEFWENYFSVLHEAQIPIYMVSSTFREHQFFFKWYGSFFKKTLSYVTHFFVQTTHSKQVLKNNGFMNCTVSGDTRYDRVNAQLSMNNTLEFIQQFKADRLCMVLGSTWGECEEAFIETLNNASNANLCFIIAPHEINAQKISALKSKLTVDTSVYSQGINNPHKVLIIDAIGFLTRIYSYADIAYVGGGFGNAGLHNILEPAVFGTPIITGPNISKFPEAKALEASGGLKIVTNKSDFNQITTKLTTNAQLKNKMSTAAANFVKNQVGATSKIITFLTQNHTL